MTSSLPAGFETLEPFVERFSISGTANRAELRSDITGEERSAFYEAAKDLVAPALDLLDKKPLDALDASEKRLLDLCLSFAHVALAVEIQGPDEERHSRMRQYMRITRSPADAVA
ncbi:MAG: hypothetical protein H6917_07015 [Novosphingobium sp.]|nr:hypothetical protein [Novosphingobium sp.]MCP5402122.1 hypothetical protein [Novosphingobium sp.]